MRTIWRDIAVGLFTAALTACGGGGGGSSGTNPGPTPTAEEWLILASDTGNNVTAFKASASSPIHTPIPQQGQPVNLGNLALGEVHFANGKAFITISSGLTGPTGLGSGGIVVVNPNTLQVENTVTLESTATGRKSRPVHVYLDPEAKFLWVNNDGPSSTDPDPAVAATASAPDSVFRINVDPTDTNATDASGKYLDVVEILVGNGHKKSAFSRPNTNKPTAKKLFFTSDLTEKRINVIDDDPAHAGTTYGHVIKIIRNVGNVPHGMDYSPNSGRVFAGLTGGGVIAVDATRLDQNNDGIIDIPDFDCGATPNCSGDPSVFKVTAGVGNNPNLLAGYIHVHTNDHGEDLVYTSGYSSGAGFLTAISPGGGDAPPSAAVAIDLGDMSPSSFNTAANKIYIPSSGTGTIQDKVKVVNVDHDDPNNFNKVIKEITIGAAAPLSENRNGKASPDGRLVVYPNTSTNTVSVIDTQTDTVIDTPTLTGSARTVGVIHLPFDAEDNQ